MTKWDLSQKLKTDITFKKINVIYYINRIQKKNCMIISTNAEQGINKISHKFTISILRKLGILGNFLNLIKGICKPHIANII